MASLVQFGVVVPGRPLMSDFQAVNETKAVALLEHPTLVAELTFFLLPTTPVPPGYGAILYYAAPPFTNWVLIGGVDPSKPSGIFRTGWPTNEELVGVGVVQLGIALEPLETLGNLEQGTAGVENGFAYAHKIALDLFQFMASFASSSSQPGAMLVPNNIFDTWLERFERKYRLDPTFFLKSNQ